MNYFQCTVCFQIEPDSNWSASSPNGLRKCPHCQAEGKHHVWPNAEIQELISFVQHYDRMSPSYGQVTCVFLASALELMLEELLSVMAFMDLLYDEVAILVDSLLEAYQGRSRMLQLYTRLGYDSFPKEIEKLGRSEFWEHWNTIALSRNLIVHGKLGEGRRITPDLIVSTVEEALAVFSLLHNKYNQESLQYKTALGHGTGVACD